MDTSNFDLLFVSYRQGESVVNEKLETIAKRDYRLETGGKSVDGEKTSVYNVINCNI
ncbi:hypothetical protein SDC9_60392 [bioreactor metagenome]|uniref:Uncharacterized protein n=1 Tax=bioreactor metagenome TaxID=1076179 RepID=A0A644XCX3_9ZZZZ